MTRIISIETSTALCSAALSEDTHIVAFKESREPKAHAALTAKFVKEMLDENGLRLQDCDAVCVSMGPGSYTGLRVGVSTAKGLCFGGKLPLLATGTLDVLVQQAIEGGLLPDGCKYIVPMIDARRMEAYTAVFTAGGEQIRETKHEIFTQDSYLGLLEEGPVLFIGDAAGKCATVISHTSASFCECCPKASSMPALAMREYKEKRLRDVAYFEPFYLKEFVATVSRKNILPGKQSS